MPLRIKDEAAINVVLRLARARGLTMTEAVRVACEEALARDDRTRLVVERLTDIHQRVRHAARTGEKADKGFFNREWGERHRHRLRSPAAANSLLFAKSASSSSNPSSGILNRPE